MRARLTSRQKHVLRQIASWPEGVSTRAFPNHSGNIIERLLAKDYVRVDLDHPRGPRVLITDLGRKTLGTKEVQ